MNRLILISPEQGSGFKPIVSGNNKPIVNSSTLRLPR
jgi:hypothetical protein